MAVAAVAPPLVPLAVEPAALAFTGTAGLLVLRSSGASLARHGAPVP